jgi:hypothetical protein
MDLQTAFAAETHRAEGQLLEKQLNMVKLRMFREGTRMATVSRTEGQLLAPLSTIINKEFWQELIAYFPLIQGPQRRRHIKQLLYCCVCIRCGGNVFAEPLPSNRSVT